MQVRPQVDRLSTYFLVSIPPCPYAWLFRYAAKGKVTRTSYMIMLGMFTCCPYRPYIWCSQDWLEIVDLQWHLSSVSYYVSLLIVCRNCAGIPYSLLQIFFITIINYQCRYLYTYVGVRLSFPNKALSSLAVLMLPFTESRPLFRTVCFSDVCLGTWASILSKTLFQALSADLYVSFFMINSVHFLHNVIVHYRNG